MRALAWLVALAGAVPAAFAAEGASRPPIIDVHLHGYPADLVISAESVNPVTGRPPAARG